MRAGMEFNLFRICCNGGTCSRIYLLDAELLGAFCAQFDKCLVAIRRFVIIHDVIRRRGAPT